jgi:signal peptidase I
MKIRSSRLASQKTVGKKPSLAREIVEWAVTLGLAVGLALAVHAWVGELITVLGPSMQPNLWENEKVLVGKVEYYFAKPKRGDIVIVKFPDRTEDIIKRVIATGGERIRVTGGYVYINDQKLDEPYELEPANHDDPEITVPADSIFVMGDNRNDSHDSRDVGPIPLKDVIGRAYVIVWPVDNWGKLTNYIGTFVN